MPPKKKEKRMTAATHRHVRSKSPESEVCSFTQEAPNIVATQEVTQCYSNHTRLIACQSVWTRPCNELFLFHAYPINFHFTNLTNHIRSSTFSLTLLSKLVIVHLDVD